MTEKKTAPKRARPTVAAMRGLEQQLEHERTQVFDLKLKLEGAAEVPGTASQVEEYEARIKDANTLLAEASTRIQDLEGQLTDALEGKDHSQGEDLPEIPEGRTRYFVDLTKLHSDYLERAAAREGRQVGNMIERIIRIDRSKSPDKAGQVQNIDTMPAADSPQIPITG